MTALFDLEDCNGVTFHKVKATDSRQFVKARTSDGLLVSECEFVPGSQVGITAASNALEQAFNREFFKQYPFAWECDRGELLALGEALAKAKKSDEKKVLKESRIWPILKSQRGLDIGNFCMNLVRCVTDILSKLL
ncbi:hypothetical protein [uncultured Roseobacter sp.]|uniref:hypothetical protein n=1 Tax=uncultured Roseobacter sp. TaxID=114847 RepID=UPI00260E91E3|nr:hypothetical protein [uncultured Roseobacter sp.]